MSLPIHAISAPFPGVTQVLRHGRDLGLWDLTVLGDGEVGVRDADLYLLGAWHPIYEEVLHALSANRKSKFVVLWTSSAGEVGLEPVELEFLRGILADERIARVWFGHRPLAQAFSEKGFYAPYPVRLPSAEPAPALEEERTMTLFCPPTLKKNLFSNQVAASLLAQRGGLVLETNCPVPEVLARRLPHRQYDWLPEERYRPLLAASRLNLCASWCETLNYQSLEAAFLGVPNVGSRAIPWLPAWACAEPSDPMSIARTGEDVLGRGPEQRVQALAWAEWANVEARLAMERLAAL